MGSLPGPPARRFLLLPPSDELVHDLLHDVAGVPAIGRDLEGRDVVVGARAGRHQRADAVERVADLQYRPPMAPRALVDRLGAGGEHDHGTALLEHAAVLLAHHGAATGVDDDLVQPDAAPYDLGLVVAEDLLAVELEDVGDAHATDAFDDAVGVDEGQLQAAREFPADATLTGAHEARHREPGDHALTRQVPPGRVHAQ